MTQFLDIHEFSTYAVSDDGVVVNKRSGRPLKAQMNQYDVVYVSMLRDDGEQSTRSLSLLVAMAFLPMTNSHFDTPINLDGNPYNCSVENLMWRPRWFARKYNQQFRSDEQWQSYPILDVATGEIFQTVRECGMRFGLLDSDIVMSIASNTVVWPTYQKLEPIEPA